MSESTDLRALTANPAQSAGAGAAPIAKAPKDSASSTAKKSPNKKLGFFHKHQNRLISFGLCLAICGLCVGMLFRHYRQQNPDDLIASMENGLLDMRFLLRGKRAPTGKVGVLAIDERSLQKFGRWPFSRKLYEQAFKNLKKLGVEWVGFDVTWSEPERAEISDVMPNLLRLRAANSAELSKLVPSELAKIEALVEPSLADQSIARMVKSFGKIVLGYFYYDDKRDAAQLGNRRFAGLERMDESQVPVVNLPKGMSLDNYPRLSAHGVVANIDFVAAAGQHFGFFNNNSDDDGIMRWVTLVRVIDGRLMPSMSLKVAAEMLGRVPIVDFDSSGVMGLSLVDPESNDDLKIPVDHQGQGRILINHLGPGETILHFSLADAYDNRFTAAQKKALKGRSLILGPTAIAINDQRANPFDAGINGVENHAAVVDNIMSKSFMRRTDSIYVLELSIIVAIALLFAPLMIYGRAAFSGVAALVFLAGFFAFDRYFWFGRGEWVYLGMPCIEIVSMFIGTTLFKYMVEEREKRKLKGTFSLYLSPDVIGQLLNDDPDALKLGGVRNDITVFFSDVRSFTTISESLVPEKLGELMNDYFTPMADIILRSQGTLDKYIGDAIMAFWGAPVRIPHHADIACIAALEMLYAMDRLRVDLPRKGLPLIDFGIGLNSGPASTGNFGSPQRQSYTAMGDTVNLGARLEGLTKDYGIKIMISEFTRAKMTRSDLFLRDLDDIRVKGKNEPVKVFELMRPDTLKSEARVKDLLGEFQLGRDSYRQQDWESAKKHFLACLSLRPDDGPSHLYLQRLEQTIREPKNADWDGVYVFKHK